MTCKRQEVSKFECKHFCSINNVHITEKQSSRQTYRGSRSRSIVLKCLSRVESWKPYLFLKNCKPYLFL